MTHGAGRVSPQEVYVLNQLVGGKEQILPGSWRAVDGTIIADTYNQGRPFAYRRLESDEVNNSVFSVLQAKF